MNLLPVEPAYRLKAQLEEQRWLVEHLWSDQAVGIVGGEPKNCKSMVALDLAVAVASGTPCLRRFAVPRPGRVLLFAAEEPLHIVRQRLEGISHAAGVALEQLDLQVITAPRVRLDLAEVPDEAAAHPLVVGHKVGMAVVAAAVVMDPVHQVVAGLPRPHAGEYVYVVSAAGKGGG